METFSINSLIIVAIIAGTGVILAPIIQVVWTMRFLIASYVAFALVSLMPHAFAFSPYADATYFGGILIVFTLIEKGRFFDVTEWLAGRFSFQSIGLAVLTVFFLSAIVCNLLPMSYMDFFMTAEIYDIFIKFIFYFAVAPLIFAILFSKRLR